MTNRRKLAGIGLVASVLMLVSACSFTFPSGGDSRPSTKHSVPRSTTQKPTPRPTPSIQGCDFTIPGALRACTAYKLNASLLSRTPFYKEGHSPSPAAAAIALAKLKDRYEGAALQFILKQTAGWPGPSKVGIKTPSISIQSVKLSPDGNTATLQTTESWLVVTEPGKKTLFVERNKRHRITMQRKLSSLLDRWVVTDIH